MLLAVEGRKQILRHGQQARLSPKDHYGKAYWLMKTQYDLGLSKIYELVINANPSYAFLLENNTLLQNKFVAAHVFGHSDFFKNNTWFGETNRTMVDVVSEHARRIREYSQSEGQSEVEHFLDAVLSIADHIDPYPQREPPVRSENRKTEHPYQDLFPRERPVARRPERKAQRIPPRPEQDLLRFLLKYADHLEDWHRDVLTIVREETLYFIPQMMTKIMNEGWATYWHLSLMREAGLTNQEFTEFARLHSSVCTPGGTRLNPYYVGLAMWKDIEERFGREKLFEVRELENDVSFIRLYLTEQLVQDLDLFLFQLEEDEWTVTSKNWERVRDAICNQMTNFGFPLITVEDGDYRGRRELFMRHHFEGRELDLLYAERTLQHIYSIWLRPVHLETAVNGHTVTLSCEGDKVTRHVQQ